MWKRIRWMQNCIAMILLFLLFAITLCIAGGYQTYQRALQERPIADVIDTIRAQSSYTLLSQVPHIYRTAVLSVEDPRFYQHHGIDFIAVAEAVVRDIQEKRLAAGGSTITQQFCKNQFFTRQKKFTRKIAEVFMVREIEKRYSKDEILELYINSIYYGDGYYNLADASEGYFNKSVSALNDWECTLLAGLPNAPSVYTLTKNPELALQRQQQVLDAMLEHGTLTQKKMNEILAQCPEVYKTK